MADLTRGEFFRSLIAGGATVRDTRGRKKTKHLDIRLYHGPMTIPPHVAEAIREDPTPHRTKDRHLVSRYAEADGTVWLFRCQIPAHRSMVGEIVQSPIGQRKRIHCWSAAIPGDYDEPLVIVERKAERESAQAPESAIDMAETNTYLDGRHQAAGPVSAIGDAEGEANFETARGSK